MKLTKVAFAVAGLLAAFTGTVHAGQIGSSSTTLAKEVINSNNQVILAPSKTYNFSGDIDARTNGQQFQLQYTLENGGLWPVGANTVFNSGTGVLHDVSNANILRVAYGLTNGTQATALPTGSVVNAFVTPDRKTLAFNVTIPSGGGITNDAFLLKTPVFTLNPETTGGLTNNTGITNLFSVVGATSCPATPDSAINISFKHFTNHNGAPVLQLDANASPDSEHLRPNSTNVARLLNFTQNLNFAFTPWSQVSQTDANTLNTTFQLSNGVGNWSGATATVPTGSNAALLHYMGQVRLSQIATGLDHDYTTVYGNPDGTPGFTAAEFLINNPGTTNTGVIELQNFALTFTLPAAWPAGTSVQATDTAGNVIAQGTIAQGATTVTLTATTEANAAQLANGAHLWAQFPGTAGISIPQTSGVSATATLVKATGNLGEQNNISCAGSLPGIGGGIKIDVRNYASFATYGETGPRSLIRVINNSEFSQADVYAQIIYANGKYGPWGKLGDLAPRAAVNFSNQQIEALLTNTASATNPFGATTSYAADSNAAVQAAQNGAGDRLRIVSNSGTTLRVQSFIAYPNGVVLDTSNAQGVDFENNATSRVPTNAKDAQPVSQDAINGLAR